MKIFIYFIYRLHLFYLQAACPLATVKVFNTIDLDLDLDFDWVKSQDLSERVIVGPSDLSRLRNPLLSPPYGAPGQCATGNPAGTGSIRRL